MGRNAEYANNKQLILHHLVVILRDSLFVPSGSYNSLFHTPMVDTAHGYSPFIQFI